MYGGISSRLMLFLILNNFIIPSIRKRFPPEMVNVSVAFVLLVAALKIWLYEGVGSLLAGLLLFQLLPEARRAIGPLQTRKWRHVAFFIGVYIMLAPCFYVAFLGAYSPDSLETIQNSPMVRVMCKVLGASRGVPDYYEVPAPF
jgi:hypothetical protein